MSKHEHLDPNNYEIESAHSIIMVPGTQSGNAWMASHFDFLQLDSGDLLVIQREQQAGRPPDVILLSSGAYVARMRRKEVMADGEGKGKRK